MQAQLSPAVLDFFSIPYDFTHLFWAAQPRTNLCTRVCAYVCLHVCVLYEPCLSNWGLTFARQLLGGLSYLLSPVLDLWWSLKVVSTVPEGKDCVWSLFCIVWIVSPCWACFMQSWRDTLKVFTGPAVDTSVCAASLNVHGLWPEFAPGLTQLQEK